MNQTDNIYAVYKESTWQSMFFRKPPYPVDPICEKNKKVVFTGKGMMKVYTKFISRTIFYDMILSDFEKSGNFQEHEP